MPEKLSLAAFGQKIKAKYPEYAEIPDEDLARRILDKYPEYGQSVDASAAGTAAEANSVAARARANLERIRAGGDIPDGSPLDPNAEDPGIPGVMGALAGAGKGMLRGIRDTSDLVSRGMDPTGATTIQQQIDRVVNPELDEALEPKGTAERVGAGVELVAEIVGGPVLGGVRAIGRKALEEGARRSILRALAPTTKANKALADKVAPEIIERGLIGPDAVRAGTQRGLLDKATSETERIGQQIDDLTSAVADQTIPLRDLNKALDDAVRGLDFGVTKHRTGEVLPVTELQDAAVREAARVKKRLSAFVERGEGGNLVVRLDQLREFRKALDYVASKKGAFTGAIDADGVLAAQEALANAIRRELAKKNPEIAKLNKTFTFWRRIERIMGATVARVGSQSQPMGMQVQTAAGAAAGFATGDGDTSLAQRTGNAVLGALLFKNIRRVTTSVGWDLVAAQTKSKLANLAAKGKLQAANDLLMSVLGARAVGAGERPGTRPGVESEAVQP